MDHIDTLLASNTLFGGRPTTRSSKGIVAAAHPLAANAGAQILRQGGNAFDAVVATAAVLNVVEPFMSGLAGAGVATFFQVNQSKFGCIDFIPTVPQNFETVNTDKKRLETGPIASLGPGCLAGWHAIQQRLGKLQFSDLLQPAIQLAQDGFPVSAFFAAVTRESSKRILDNEWKRVFHSDHYWRPGELLKLPDLSNTLSAIAEKGIRHLYGGELGLKMVSHLQAYGGIISINDLDSISPLWENTLSAEYRGHVIHVPPPPSESFQMLLSLRILEAFDLGSFKKLGVKHLDTVLRAIRIAAGVRIKNNQKSINEIHKLLNDVDLLIAKVKDGNPVKGLTEQWDSFELFHDTALREHTTSISVGDEEGNLVCLTQSIGSLFGSGTIIPSTGVLMNNFLFWGDQNPSSPNQIIPGKRLAMCLAPTITSINGNGFLALGTPGSYGILQTQVQVMVYLLDFDLELQDAINMPRARLFDGAEVHIEKRIDDTTLKKLVSLGHKIKLLPEFSWRTGGMHAVSRDPKIRTFSGAADNRRDGNAIPV